YGANMHRAVRCRHAAAREPIAGGPPGDRHLVSTADGYASLAPEPARTRRGVLRRITPRDRAPLDAWENVAGKLYRAEILPVRQADRLSAGPVFVGRAGGA